MTLLLSLALVAHVVIVSAMTIRSAYKDVTLVDGVPSVQATITIECNGGADFGVAHTLLVQSDSGVVHHVNVTCRYPEHHFDVYRVGYTFADGRLLRVEQCLIRNYGRFSAANATEPQVSTGRSLLSVNEDASDCEAQASVRRGAATGAAIGTYVLGLPGTAIGAFVGAGLGGMFRTPKCTTGQSDGFNSITGGSVSLYLTSDARGQGNGLPGTNPAPWVSDATKDALSCVGTPNLHSATGTNCFTGPTAQQLTDLVNRGADMVASNTRWAASLITEQQATIAAIANVTAQVEELKGYAKSVNTTIGVLVDEALREYDVQKMIADDLKNQTRANQDSLRNASRLLSETANATALYSSMTEQNFARAAAEVVANSLNFSSALESISHVQDQNRLMLQTQIRTTQRYVVNLATIQKRWFLNEDLRNGLSLHFHAALDEPLVFTGSTGAFLGPFLKDLGTRPTDPYGLDPNHAAIEVSNEVFKYVVGDSRYAVQTRLQFVCGSAFMVSKAPVSPSWRELLSLIGPLVCDTTLDNPDLPICQCFVRVSELRCPVSGPLGPSTQAAFDSSPLTLDTQAGCTVNPVPFAAGNGGMDGRVVTTASGLADILQTISLRGVSPSTNYSAASILPNLKATVPWSAFVSNSSNFISLVSGTIGESPDATNLAFWYTQSVLNSYAIVYGNLGYYQSLVYGRIPAGVTQRPTMYKRFKQGGTGRCMELSAMLYSDEMLLVSAFVPGQVITNVEVTIDGVTSLVSDVGFTSPKSSLLPNSPWVWSPSKINSQIWSIPKSEISIGPSPFQREKKVTYPMCYDLEHCDYQAWMDNNGGFAFNHPAGGNVPAPYSALVDSDPTSVTYGRCITQPKAPGGTLCEMRDNFRVFASGDFEDVNSPGTMIFVDREPVYVARITVPEGAIVEVLSSACPIVRRTPVSGTQLLIELVNPLNETNQIQLDEVGECPKSSSLSLGPGRAEVYTASACDGPDTLKISYYQGQTLTECPVSVDLAFTPESLSSFRGAGSLNLTYSMMIQRRDAVLLAIEQLRSDVLGAIMETQIQSLRAEQELGFRVSDETMLGYNDLLAKVNAIIQQSNDVASAAYASDVDIEKYIVDLESFLAQSQDTLSQSYAQGLAFAESFKERNRNNPGVIALLQVVGEKEDVDFGKAVNDTSAFYKALRIAVNASVQTNPYSNWRRTDLPPGEKDNGEGSKQAWKRVGDFFARIASGEGGAAVGGLIASLFNGPAGLISNLFSGGPLSPLMNAALVVMFLVAIAVSAVTLVHLWRWASRPRVYEGDADALAKINAVNAKIEEEIKRLREM